MRLWVPVVSVLVCGFLLAQQDQTTGEDLKAKIEHLVKQLGHEDFQKREQAMEELVKIGEPALKALKEAAKSDDPEVVWRAKEAIKRIKSSHPQENRQKEEQSFPIPQPPRLPELPKPPDLFKEGGFEKWLKKFWKEHQKMLDELQKQLDEDLKELERTRREFEKKMRQLFKQPQKPPQTTRKEQTVILIGPNGKMRIKRYVWKDGRLVEKIEKEVPASLAVLGADLTSVPDFLRYHLRLKEKQGLLVNDIKEESPLRRSGIRRGDIILAVDGKPIFGQDDFCKAIEDKEKVKITVLQAGEKKEIEVKLR